MKFKLWLGQKKMLVFALIVRCVCKNFRLPKQRLHWYSSAQRCWMIYLPGPVWGSIGSLDMLGNEVADNVERCGSVQKFVGPEPSFGVSRQNMRLNTGCIISIWQCVVLVVLRDRLKNWFQAIVQLQRLDYCPWIGHNPGLSLALLDITVWKKNIFI
jgi:hypothetical protein